MMAADSMGNPPQWALDPGYSGEKNPHHSSCSEQCPKASKTLVFVGHPILLVGRWFSYWIKDDCHSFLLFGRWFSYWIKVISSKLAGINPSSCNQRNHQAFRCILGLFFWASSNVHGKDGLGPHSIPRKTPWDHPAGPVRNSSGEHVWESVRGRNTSKDLPRCLKWCKTQLKKDHGASQNGNVQQEIWKINSPRHPTHIFRTYVSVLRWGFHVTSQRCDMIW